MGNSIDLILNTNPSNQLFVFLPSFFFYIPASLKYPISLLWGLKKTSYRKNVTLVGWIKARCIDSRILSGIIYYNPLDGFSIADNLVLQHKYNMI